MAVKIVSKITLKKLGILVQSTNLLKHKDVGSTAYSLDNSGYKLQLTMNHVAAVEPSGQVIAEINVKTAHLNAALKGKLSNKETKLVALDCASLIMQAKAHFDENNDSKPVWTKPLNHPDAYTFVLDDIKSENKVKAIKAHRALTGASLKESKDVVDLWWDTYWGNIQAPVKTHTTVSTNGTAVHLLNAKHIGQAVRGTSPKARYYLIAIGKEAKVAAKMDDGYGIAVRVEPMSVAGSKKKLEAAGFETTQGSHWSLHLEPNTLQMAQRTIGSLLYALNMEFDHVMTDVAHLKVAA